MLVLTRKLNEKVLIEIEGLEKPIELIIVKIEKNNVRLGISADQSVTILRSELTERPEGRAAAKVAG